MKAFVATLAIVAVAGFVLLALRSALRVLWLAVGPTQGAREHELRETTRLKDDLDIALRNLREVRFDHATGKLDDSDAAELSARYERRALGAMSALEKPKVAQPPDPPPPLDPSLDVTPGPAPIDPAERP